MASLWATNVTDLRPIVGQRLNYPAETLSAAIAVAVEKDPERVLYTRANGQQYTLGQFYALARQVGKACLSFHLERFDGVAILGFNSVEWFAADVGAVLAGGLPSGIYTTNKAKIVSYILQDSRSRIIFVDDMQALEKVLSIVHECPNLKAIVIWGEVDLTKYPEHKELVYKWNDFIALADGVSDADLDARSSQQVPENVCKLIYTSGTTGPPKGVMVSHDNVVFTVRLVADFTGMTSADHLVSFLPCSHIAANVVDIAGPILGGFQLTFAEPDALKGSLVKTLKKIRPTVFVAVPRVYEKIQEKLLQIGAQSGPVKRAISSWAKSIGIAASQARDSGDDLMPWGYQLARMLVFDNVKKALGLDRCRLVVNTAAPLQNSTDAYFKSLDICIADVYGMSEATGPLTSNIGEYRAGSSGKPIRGCEVKVLKKDETGEGELCFRGRNIFVGYLHNPQETAKTIDDEGFIHSGDLGRIDEDGFITITGRAKELIVTAGGENVAPALAEATVRSELPALSRVLAVGDKKKFVSCLVVPYINDEGELVGPASEINPEIKTVAEAANDSAWEQYINEGLERANKHAISNAAKIRKFRMLPNDFSVDGGELTPSMKVKRRIVVHKYAELIDSMYA
ncbi:Long-chain-fatty-acid--CoA ligase ACSBG2 [Gracilariopsis chorda]|uniref:Long-chain-fatty-acid--CoA ligase ACSBG2 n=1 Tax=Gracilariopsis chorda TaxID=448386 RepID=A0A2V3IGW4_9FLOR|nr:Long-chain-fatty-acid--CoA ligase ACSBG2 [Gracilariopsis chorda]|eukprot:PXF41346.1 Long-chain-fatty-acid--CoA ligase ACSBG2 [Gracilariopsis chorda]